MCSFVIHIYQPNIPQSKFSSPVCSPFTCGASISMISISLDVRKVQKIQKGYFLANVNVDGKNLKKIKKINILVHLMIVHCGNSVLTDGR